MKNISFRFVVLVFFLVCVCAVASAAIMLPESLQIIDAEAFYGDTSINKVIVPDGTTEIRSKAFANSSLAELVLPASLTFIAEDAFAGCGMISVEVPEGCYAYERCVELGLLYANDVEATPAHYFSYTIRNKQVTIDEYLFPDGIHDVVVPRQIEGYPVTMIGEEAFASRDKNYLLKSITLPNTVTVIYKYAFFGCKNLKNVVIPNSVTMIGSSAFQVCGLTSIAIPDSVTIIGPYAFAGCGYLENVILPQNIERIEAATFRDCYKLKKYNNPPEC